VIPADRKWYTRYLVSELLVKTLEDINPKYPELTPDAQKDLAECAKQLNEEK
jgi:hypothetical protein